MNLLQEYEENQAVLLARWRDADNAISDTSELMISFPVIYCDEEQLLWEARIEYVAYDYVTLRYTRSQQSYVVLVTEMEDIRRNGILLIELTGVTNEQTESNSQSPE